MDHGDPDEPGDPGEGRLVIGVDVGGTKTLGVLVRLRPDVLGGAPRAEVLDRELAPSGAATEAAVDGVVAVAGALARRAGRPVAGVGVGLAGFVDRAGVVRRAPNAAGLEGRDVAGRVRAELAVPVVVDNDANCVAVAARSLEAPEARHLVAITFGTGIGGGLIVDGRLVHGANGFAGEPGHMVIDPSGPDCPCGQRGCWERYASGTGLAWLGRRAVEAGEAPGLLTAAGSAPAVRGEHVTALVAEGDAGAEVVFDRYAGYVALGVANLILLLDPEVVVLGGGLSAADLGLADRVRRHLRERFVSAMADRSVRVVGSPGGPEAGALGAALLADVIGGAPGPGRTQA